MQRWWWLPVALLLVETTALAHSLGNSFLTLQREEAALRAPSFEGTWRVEIRALDALIGLDTDQDQRVSDAEIAAQSEWLGQYLLSRLELRTGGQPCALHSSGSLDAGAQQLTLPFRADCEARGTLSVRYDLFLDHDPNHEGHLQLIEGERVRAFTFTREQRSHSVEPGAASLWQPILEYTIEGVWHIWVGYDHILFLLTLLLPAVLRRQDGRWEPAESFHAALWRVTRIVTAFTLAHSITLALASMRLVVLPGRWVETAIAASVVVAAINNLYPVFTARAWVLAFGFGLLHGFGFASVLAELGLPPGALAVSLLSFNLGVELGQIAIVAALLPLLYLATRRTQHYVRYALAGGSIAVAAMASLWCVERAFDVSAAESVARILDADSVERAARATRRGEALLRDGKLDEAERAFQQALEAQRATGNALAESHSLSQLAELSVARAELSVAQQRYQEALTLAAAAGDTAWQAELQRQQAQAYQLAGQHVDAARAYRHALELHEALGDERAVAQDCRLLASSYRHSEQWAPAVALFQRSADIHERLGATEELAADQAKLGIVLQLQGELTRARQATRRALTLDEGLGRRLPQAHHHANLGTLERLLGHEAQAREHYERASALYVELGEGGRSARVQELVAALGG